MSSTSDGICHYFSASLLNQGLRLSYPPDYRDGHEFPFSHFALSMDGKNMDAASHKYQPGPDPDPTP
jgi:hypothetical protein